jgi:hypothetical protein
MHQFDGIPRNGGTTAARTDENTPAEGGVLQQLPTGNLARGIVWADILADIAADEQARQMRRDLPEAA